jgi:cytochrome P450
MAVANRYDEVPGHVPPTHVVDFDIYRPPGVEKDLHAAWTSLQKPGVPDVVWTPRNGGHWIVTRGEDIKRLFADAELLASEVLAVPIELGAMMEFIPLQLDPPEHAKYRSPVTKGFASKYLLALEGPIVAMLTELIDGLRGRSGCEFVSEVAEVLPVNIFLQFAGLPVSERPMLRKLGQQLSRGEGDMTPGQLRDVADEFLRPYVTERLARPGDDLFSRILSVPVDGEPWTLEAARRMCRNLLFGGLDTVAAMLGFMTWHLARNPDHLRALRENPAIIDAATDELSRRYASVSVGRSLTRDYDLGGVLLKRGDVVYLSSILHNLDERMTERATEVRFDRRATGSLTFGSGPHRCVGLALARLEIVTFLREWPKHFPDFRLDPGRPVTMKGGGVGAITCLPILWS